MTRIAIFASGAGSNAQKIIDYFSHPSADASSTGSKDPEIRVSLVVCNKPGAGVLTIAVKEGIDTLIIEKERFFRGDAYVDEIRAKGIDFIVLAGFLWKIPYLLIQAFPGAIVNIHPALLPAYGGKGMYGSNVHEAVINARETSSGITIHWVDEHYDNGDIIFQAKCSINESDTSQSLAEKIHKLEHTHYPRIIEEVIKSAKSSLKPAIITPH